MANDNANTQLPIMVRKPKVVWPGLVKMGMYQKQIAGDGNCLFASLSDQLYGTPIRHAEIRTNVIEHMRALRPLFEHYVHIDDVQQRRALRSTVSNNKKDPDDAFEDYLTLMSRTGTYGGEPELVAFCQVYNQDVTVHLPQIRNFDRDSIQYTNVHRTDPLTSLSLHICYGGDEITRAHYNSARSRDGSRTPLSEQRDARLGPNSSMLSSSPSSSLTARAIRNSRSDLSSELIYDLLQKGRRDVDGSLDLLNDKPRARSSSVSSSHRSSSSKRSLDDDTDYTGRSTKRAASRRGARRRKDILLKDERSNLSVFEPLRSEHSSESTPNSTQETDSPEPSIEASQDDDTDEPGLTADGSSESDGVGEDSDSQPTPAISTNLSTASRKILPTRSRRMIPLPEMPQPMAQL